MMGRVSRRCALESEADNLKCDDDDDEVYIMARMMHVTYKRKPQQEGLLMRPLPRERLSWHHRSHADSQSPHPGLVHLSHVDLVRVARIHPALCPISH